MSVKSQILNFDTMYSTYQQDNTNTASTLSPYNCNFVLPNPIQNVKRISLLSIELPVMFSNTRRTNTSYIQLGNTNINPSLGTLVVNYTNANGAKSFTLNISPNNEMYNDISSLITSLNSKISALMNGTSTIVFSQNSTNTNLLQIVTTNLTVFYITQTNFSRYILGFIGNEWSGQGGNYIASFNYNLNVDNYLNMILNVPHNSQNVNGVPCSFKIPVNANGGQIFYYGSNSGYSQFITISDDHYLLKNINVVMRDRFNNSIDPRGGDFSFSLLVEYIQ